MNRNNFFLKSFIAVGFACLGFAVESTFAQNKPTRSVDEIFLPTGRTIAPAGETVSFYGRPVDMETSKDGKYVFVKDRNHLRVLDTESLKIAKSITIKGGASLYGIVCDDSDKMFISNSKNLVHVYQRIGDEFAFAESIELPVDSFPCGLELASDQQTLFVCLSKKNSVAAVNLKTNSIDQMIPVGVAPFDVCRVGNQLVVTNIGGRLPRTTDQTAPSAGTATVVDDRGIASSGTVSIISIKEMKVVSDIKVGLHPSAIEADGENCLVCNSNEDTVSIVNLKKMESTSLNVKPIKQLPFGSMPTCAKWLGDKQHLLVTLAGNNAVALYKRTNDANKNLILLGHIPTAWYPASIACTEKDVFVGSIKGFGSRSERRNKEKGRNSHDHQGVVQRIAIADLLNSSNLKRWSKQVEENARLPQILRNQMLAENPSATEAKPITNKLGEPSVFKHVIYVIKENRTFDQIFGDYEQARSEPKLCIFPRERTPNHHALADQFGILDNYYCNGILSADGHSWATEGNVTPYLERAFGGFSRSYTFGNDPITYSSSGFIWDHVLAAGLSFRSYGEMDYATAPGGIKYQEIFKRFEAGEEIEFEQNIGIDRLRKYACRNYPGWNMDIPDVLRMDRFLKEFREFEKNKNLPNLCILYLPEDHLGAAGVTSNAHMADNDLALGRLVEAVSNSEFWKETVIFVNEDDPQNGFDHIDGHRSICLAISPYSKSGVNHNFYNQTSVLRTILHIFGLPPMNQQDASAPLMKECFSDTPNLVSYKAITPTTKLNEAPEKQSNWSPTEAKWRRILASVPIERTGMKTEQDEDNLNRFIWHETKGWETPYPVEFAGAHAKGLQRLGLSHETISSNH